MTDLVKIVNGVEMPFSAEDIAQYEADMAAAPAARWEAVRIERNARLAASDWTQLPDAPVDAAAWAEYRQELRDITSQDDPFNIVWPSEPGV
jgi:hypothetical protein